MPDPDLQNADGGADTPPLQAPGDNAQKPVADKTGGRSGPTPQDSASGLPTHGKPTIVDLDGAVDGLVFTLSEPHPDRRKNRSLFNFKIMNGSKQTIVITKLVPVEDDGMDVLVDPFAQAFAPRRKSQALREQLSRIFLESYSPPCPPTETGECMKKPLPCGGTLLAAAVDQFLAAGLGKFKGFKLCRELLAGMISSKMNRRIDKYLRKHGVLPVFDCYLEAEAVYRRMQPPMTDQGVQSKIESLLSSLKETEEAIKNNQPVIGLPPGASQDGVYVVEFDRAYVNELPNTFSLRLNYLCLSNGRMSCEGFNSELVESESKLTYSAGVSLFTPTAPRPVFVTMIAMVFGYFGAWLNLLHARSITTLTDSIDTVTQVLSQVGKTGGTDVLPLTAKALGMLSDVQANVHAVIANSSWWRADAPKATLVAAVFFNIYERTPLWDTLKLGINWRAAMVVGLLAGMLSDKVVDWIMKLFTL